MIEEVTTGQRRDDPRRRWFADDYFDLIVWINDGSDITGFQLCYDRGRTERAITWTSDGGYSHNRIDEGEANPAKNQSPILLSDGPFPADEVIERFEEASRAIDQRISRFILKKLRQYRDPRGNA
jgi:hypothetical protein